MSIPFSPVFEQRNGVALLIIFYCIAPPVYDNDEDTSS